MRFCDISRKLLRANFSRYRLYFFCNLFAAALFYCFAAIFTNRSFMDGEIVDPSISSNIYFPSLLAALFLILFLPVSFQAFLGARRREYGVLFALGMSRREAFWHLLSETASVALLALLAALAAGTMLSLGFFAVILYGIGIRGVQWRLSPEPYKITALLYALVLAVTFAWSGGRLLRGKIGVLLRAQRRPERGGLLFLLLGKLAPGYLRRHTPEWSFLRRHGRAWGLRCVLGAMITACGVLLASVCVTLCPAFLRDARSYCPYDMVYCEIDGMNQVPPERVISLLEENHVEVEQVLQIPYRRNASMNYFPVSEVNRCFAEDYQLEEGQFLNLFQYDPGDGYGHEIRPLSAVTLGGKEKLYSVGSDVKILFNQNPAFADRTLIVSDEDFEKLSSDTESWPGLANLFLFREWESSCEGVRTVKAYLRGGNQVEEEEGRYYELSSKVEKYLEAKKSGQFLVFLMAFVIGLMLTAEFLTIHFRIQAEQEEKGRAIHSLLLLGTTERELLRCLRYENMFRFLPPLILGTLLSLGPAYYLGGTYGMGPGGTLTGIAFGAAVTAGRAASLERYSKKELSGLLPPGRAIDKAGGVL